MHPQIAAGGSVMHGHARCVLAIALASGAAVFSPGPARSDTAYQPLPFVQAWSDPALVVADDDWSRVPGIVAYRGDVAGPAVDPSTISSDILPSTPHVRANRLSANDFAPGVSELQLADAVVAVQPHGSAEYPHLVLHVRTTNLQDIRVQYRLRDVDGSSRNAVVPVALHFRIGGTGQWTNVAAAFVADATTGPGQASLETLIDVALPAGAADQAQVELRIVAGFTEGNPDNVESVGIDDIVVKGVAPDPTPVCIGITAVVDSVYDAGGVLAGAVVPGSLLHGRFAYDQAFPDLDPSPSLGSYRLDAPPWGLYVAGGGLFFETDPLQVDGLITVKGSTASCFDRFVVASDRNRALPDGTPISSIAVTYLTGGCSTLPDDGLPATPADLVGFDDQRLEIHGGPAATPTLVIAATITSTSFCGGFTPQMRLRCVQMQARVDHVDDPFNVLQGAVGTGSVLGGVYTFALSTPDANALPTLGEYIMTSELLGMDVTSGATVFATDPAAPAYAVRIANNSGSPPGDGYRVASLANRPLANGVSVDSLVWDLAGTANALPNDALPPDPPILTAFTGDGLGLVLRGSDPAAPSHTYRIRAVVEDVFLCADQPQSPTDTPGPAPAPARTRLAATVFPNPARGAVWIEYVPATAPVGVEVAIYAVDGRCVRVLRDVAVTPGLRRIAWEGCDTSGRPVARGLYVYRVRAGGATASGKFVVLR
jgi:hypothetical protein